MAKPAGTAKKLRSGYTTGACAAAAAKAAVLGLLGRPHPGRVAIPFPDGSRHAFDLCRFGTGLATVVKERDIQIGVLTVPANVAQEVADQLIAAGIRGIWNFAPVRIRVPEHVQLVSEDLSVGLSTLSFHLRRQN